VGTLILPQSGAIYIDAQIVIYTMNYHPTYEPICRPLWDAVSAGSISIFSSELTLLETLVVPYQRSDYVQAEERERLWDRPGMSLLPVTKDVLKRAAHVRAVNTAVRVPDAIHAATALHYGCACFLTNDLGFRRVIELPLTILDDVIARAH